MAGNFPPSRWIQPPAPHLAAQLVPTATVPSIIGVGAGAVLYTGAPVGIVTSQSIGVGRGFIGLSGQPVSLSIGAIPGNNVGPGHVTIFGFAASIGVQATPAPSSASSFLPALSEMGIDAWERVGLAPGALTTQHVTSMRRSMNLVLSRWVNRGINLWRVSQNTLTLAPGTATYNIAGVTIDVLDTYVTSSDASFLPSDILLTPMSRNTYAALPQKLLAGRPLMYWFDRLIAPTLTVWPAPDAAYTLTYFALSQVPDMDPVGSNQPGIPYRFYEAFIAAVAAHLSQKFGDPNRSVALDAYAKETWAEAAAEDREHVTWTLAPDLSGYYS